MKRFTMFVLLFMMMLGVCVQAGAKSKVPQLNKKTVSLKVGQKAKVLIENVTPKKVKWSVNKAGKKYISLSGKTKKSVTVKGKKAGTATVTASVTYNKKKIKKLKVKVKVSKVSTKPDSSVTIVAKKQTAFPGKVTASLNAAGYVVVKWDSVSGAHAYVVQRKTGSGSWQEVKVTASKSFTDRTVQENKEYSYQVRANCDGMCTKYSDAVTIKTGKVGKEEDPDVKDPMVTPSPTPTVPASPKPTPEPTPYQAKYSYEVEVLNQFTIYEEEYNVPIVLYIKTDNPNPNGGEKGVPLNIKGIDGWWDYDYEDIQYQEQEETNTTFFNKVKDGWIYTCAAKTAGVYNVLIQEDTGESSERYIWQTVDTFQIEVQDGERGLQEHCNNIIKTVSNDSYNEDGRGKWSTLSGQQKMERLEEYVRSHMHYPRLGAETSLGYLPVWIIQENVGAFWETGFADCGAANEMMCVLARTLGYEAHRQNTTLNGGLHIVAMVTIEGVEYKYDATPWQGGYMDWDYIL